MQRAAGMIYSVVVHVSSDISLDMLYDTLYLTVSTSQCQKKWELPKRIWNDFSSPVGSSGVFFTSDPFANNLDAGHSQKNNGFNALTNLYFNSNFQKKQNTE